MNHEEDDDDLSPWETQQRDKNASGDVQHVYYLRFGVYASIKFILMVAIGVFLGMWIYHCFYPAP